MNDIADQWSADGTTTFAVRMNNFKTSARSAAA